MLTYIRVSFSVFFPKKGSGYFLKIGLGLGFRFEFGFGAVGTLDGSLANRLCTEHGRLAGLLFTIRNTKLRISTTKTKPTDIKTVLMAGF